MPESEMSDDPALRAVTDGLVALHEQHHGRPPARAYSLMMGDDLLACLMGDMYTSVEKTMIELQRQAVVQNTRSTFHQAHYQRFVEIVEQATTRTVERFLSTHHVGPDLELALFFLAPLSAPRGAGSVNR